MSSSAVATCPSSPTPGWLTIWWLAIRPRTLTISLAPVLVGSALAFTERSSLAGLPFLAALLGAILIQIGTNLHNDAVDYLKGNDLPDRVGPPRITAAGWVSPQGVQRTALLCFALALLPGAYLVWAGGWPIFLIGCASLLAGWAYSGGPRPISYSPFGELFVLIFFGLLAVAGTYWLQAGLGGPAVWLAGGIVGLPAAAVLLVNNHRDRLSDQRAGRRTLAIYLGAANSARLYAALFGLSFILLAVLACSGHPGALAGALALPLSIQRCRNFCRASSGEAYNQLLAKTAQSGLLLSLLLSIGLLLETC
jgi:1,4-dihydroxy-2-naphthoate octaprenyltransferase